MRPYSSETYTELQAKKGRPVSPHVTIYRFPIAALTSITNRVTGVMLTVGITGIGGAALVGVDTSSALSALGAISIVGPLAKFAVAFPLSYHYLGGVRHLLWDRLPETLLTNDGVEKSSVLLVALAGAVSLGTAAL
eukprot:gene34114-44078_t